MKRFTLILLAFVLLFLLTACDNEDPCSPENYPPAAPENIAPTNTSAVQDLETQLIWHKCSDPENNPLLYMLHFSTDSNPTIYQTAIEDTFYTVNNLTSGQTYYWRVTAYDNRGNLSAGEVWEFDVE